MQSDYLRIERVIRFLEERFQEQPSLEDLAAHIGLSPFHLQRLFKNWAGISPKRFLQFLTVDFAKELLREHRSVLDAAYESGLSSPSRLYDSFVAIDAVTPGEFKRSGTGLRIHYGLHASPFGECLLAATQRGICNLSFVSNGGAEEAISDLEDRWRNAALIEHPQTTEPLVKKIFGGKDPRQKFSLFLKGTNFQIKVWEALLRVPPSFVCTYADVANYIGVPKGARAVGSAVAVNPVAYLIPCHRVIRGTGSFGEYRYGSRRKKMMIGWELAKLG